MGTVQKSMIWVGLVSILQVINSGSVLSAGFEKAVPWSGRYGGLGGAAVSNVSGSQSLFFNPAGLAGNHGLEVDASVSPTLSSVSAPILPGTIASSAVGFSLPLAGFVSYEFTPRWGLAVGYYLSGGAKATYSVVDFSSVNANYANLKPTLKSELSITELSVGTGYEIIDGLRIGGAYRIVMVNGGLSTASVSSTALVAVSVDDLSATQYSGLRFGIQYSPKDSRWGLGAHWRNEIPFTASGTSSGSFITVAPSATVTSLPGTSATVANVFPQQLSFGGFFDIIPTTLRVLAQYDFTEYNRNQSLNLSGLVLPGGATSVSVPQNWNNMSDLRFGIEYRGIENWAIRAGYVIVSQVTPNATSRATFSTPGLGNTIALGAGTSPFKNLSVDVAAEYNFSSGTVAAAENSSFPGDYSSSAYAVHLTANYRIL